MVNNFIAVSYLGTSDIEQVLIDEKVACFNNTWVHVDIMDGIFVPNKSFETKEKYEMFIDNLLNKKVLDVHIMVKDVKWYIDMLSSSKYKPDYITFHYEAVEGINECIKLCEYIKTKGIKVGVSIKPNTDYHILLDFINYIDLILVMSVEPGKGGQSFIIESIDKLKYFDEYRNINNLKYKLEVDGGINDTNIKKVSLYCDAIVVGSYLCKHLDELTERMDKLENEVHAK